MHSLLRECITMRIKIMTNTESKHHPAANTQDMFHLKTGKFRVGNTLEAYLATKKKYPQSARNVFEAVLTTDYLELHSNKLTDAINHAIMGRPEVTRSELINKLSFSLPNLKIEKCSDKLFDIEERKKLAAACILNVLIDSKELTMCTKVTSFENAKGRRITIPQYVIQTGQNNPEKNMLYGLEREPNIVYQSRIGHIKVSRKAKEVLAVLAGIPYQLSDIATPGLIQKGYELTHDYWSKSREAGASKRIRYRKQAELLGNIEGIFYLPCRYDSSYRVYYEFQTAGLRPQGKDWECNLIDLGESYKVTEEDAVHAKHVIYVMRHGRTSMVDALAKFSDEDREYASSADPMDKSLVYTNKDDDTPIKEFGNRIVLMKAARILDCYDKGESCNYMLAKDLTTSGLLFAANGFSSAEMAKHCGLTDTLPESAYKAWGKELGSVEDPKSEMMGLLHGGTFFTVSQSTGIPEEEVISKTRKLFGDCFSNIATIAEWGQHLVDNYCNILQWKNAQGYKCYFKSEMEHVPLKLKAPSAWYKTGMSNDTVVCTMPLAVDSSNNSVYANGYGAGTHSKEGVKTKRRGLYARITHSIDASLLHSVVTRTGVGLMVKHDAFFARPAHHSVIAKIITEFFIDLQGKNPYQDAVDQVAEHRKSEPLQLSQGEGFKVSSKQNFYMP